MSQGEIDTAVPFDVAQAEPLPPRRKSWFRIRRDWPIVLLITTIVVGWILYAWIYPAIEIRQKIATTKWKYSPRDPEISYRIKFIQRTVEYLFVFWFFYLGASIGSFINVVANRTPRRKTIVTRGSHCPFCDTPLSMIDNSPVFGWILLRGRCRACRIPISPRYLIMELIVGACFTTLGIIEVIGNGWNLPYRDWQFGAGIVSTVFYPKWDLIGSFAVHCGFFATCVMLLGSQLDRLRFPTIPLLVILSICMSCFVVLRPLGPIGWREPFGAQLPKFPHPTKDLLITTILGGFVGWMLGACTQKWLSLFVTSKCESPSTRNINRQQPTSDHLAEQDGACTPVENSWGWHWLVIHTIAGSLFGWQAIVVVSIVAVVSLIVATKFYSGTKRVDKTDAMNISNEIASASDERESPTNDLTPRLEPQIDAQERSDFITEIHQIPPKRFSASTAHYRVLRVDVLALAILTGTLFLHLCWWRWVVLLWHFS